MAKIVILKEIKELRKEQQKKAHEEKEFLKLLETNRIVIGITLNGIIFYYSITTKKEKQVVKKMPFINQSNYPNMYELLKKRCYITMHNIGGIYKVEFKTTEVVDGRTSMIHMGRPITDYTFNKVLIKSENMLKTLQNIPKRNYQIKRKLRKKDEV